MSESDAVGGKLGVEYMTESDREIIEAGGWPNSEVTGQLREYDPQNEVVFLVLRPSGEVYCLRIHTPSGSLPPRSACEAIYQGDFRSHSFESPMNDSRWSEQDQQRAIEPPAAVKLAIQEALRACRDNLEAFHERGFVWDEVSPHVDSPGSFDSHTVLLAAVKDGIFLIDDSDGKYVVKPGPKWAKLEMILLSQDKTDQGHRDSDKALQWQSRPRRDPLSPSARFPITASELGAYVARRSPRCHNKTPAFGNLLGCEGHTHNLSPLINATVGSKNWQGGKLIV